MAVVSLDITEMIEAIDGRRLLNDFYYNNEVFHVIFPRKTKTQATAIFDASFTK